jgi:hypothetical protein
MSDKEGSNLPISILFLIVAGIVLALIHALMDGAIEILSLLPLKGFEFLIIATIIIVIISSGKEK